MTGRSSARAGSPSARRACACASRSCAARASAARSSSSRTSGSTSSRCRAAARARVAPPSIPLRPTQAVFRQKPWLPWWLAIVVPLLLLLALLLFLFLPKNATVPEVVGKKSAFEAEKAITEAKMKLAPGTKEKIDPNVPPGTVIAQTPKAGEEAEKGAEVAIQIAVGDGKLTVPAVTGKTVGDAEKILRDAGLSLGQATPQPVDPKALIKTQIPAAQEVVNEGKAVDIFMVVPKPAGAAGAAAGPARARPPGPARRTRTPAAAVAAAETTAAARAAP